MIPKFVSDPVELAVEAGVPVTISHGMGRQMLGWVVIWTDAFVQFRVQDPDADSSQELVLVPNVSANVRLVLL